MRSASVDDRASVRGSLRCPLSSVASLASSPALRPAQHAAGAKADVARRPRRAAADRWRIAAALARRHDRRLPAERHRLEAGRPVFHLWRQDVGGGAPVQLTFSEGGDPARCAALVARRQDAALPARRPVLAAAGRRRRTARARRTRHVRPRRRSRRHGRPTARRSISWRAIRATADERERDRVRDDVYAFDEDVQAAPALEDRRRHRRRDAGDDRRLDGQRVPAVAPTASASRSQRAPSPPDMDAYRGEVWVMDANGENARVLTQQLRSRRTTLELSPDGTQVLFLADTNERFEPYYPTNLFIVPRRRAARRGSRAAGLQLHVRSGGRGRRTASRSSPSSTWACTASSSGSTSPRAARSS